MVETLSEGRPLQNLDLESSRNNYSPGADCFDIPDLKMKKGRSSKIISDDFFLGYGVEESVIENVPPPETCTSSSSESFGSDHRLCNLGSQNELELFFHNEVFGDENKHQKPRIPTMSFNGRGVRNDEDEEEAEQISAKQTDCLACTSPAVLPMNCIYPQFGNVDDAVSTAAAAKSFTFSLPYKTSWSTGKPHRPSNFEEKIHIKELSPRMQRKLANLKSFRSKSFGGMLRKPLRNFDIKKDRDVQSRSFRVSEDTRSTVGTNGLPLIAPLSQQQQQQLKPNHRELHYDMEEGEGEKKMRDIDKTVIQAPKIFSSSEENLFHGGGGHESKQHTCSALTTRKGELIEKLSDMKLHQVHRLAVAKFNVDPEDCISYLVSQGLLKENCPEDMCNFILSEPGLSKRKLGEIYGKNAQYEKDVFELFLRSQNFKGLTLDIALRGMVREFRMPGEAQQVDRIMGMFAKRFMEENKGMFSCTDTAYILSFSLIMLNTDLYNRSLKYSQKMTLEQFINNNKGIDQQNDLPRELLEGYYQRIQADEIQMDEGDMYESEVLTFIAPKRSGWLKKKKRNATIYAGWNKHWFVLADGVLYYFIGPWAEAPHCIIPLENCNVSKYLTKKDFSISRCDIKHAVKSVKMLDDGSMVQGNHKEFIVRANTETERDLWVKCIGDEIMAQEERVNDNLVKRYN